MYEWQVDIYIARWMSLAVLSFKSLLFIDSASVGRNSDVRIAQSTFWTGDGDLWVIGCICVAELKEEVVYYDVCEDPEELQSMVQTAIQQTDPPAVSQLKRRLQTLESKRGNICARRAYLRNKKVWASSIHGYSFSEPRGECFLVAFCSLSRVLICA